MTPSAARWRYWRLNDLFFSERRSDAAAKVVDAFEWPRQPPKSHLLMGDVHPLSNTWFLRPTGSSSKRHGDRFSRFCMRPKFYAVQCNGEENPTNCPFPMGKKTLGISSLRRSATEKDRATVIGNMRKKSGKDRACGLEISARTDWQTDTQTCSSQYFAAVNNNPNTNKQF